MATTLKIQTPRLDATLTASTINAEERTVDMVFYSGAEVQRYSWDRGDYTLRFSMNPAHVRLGTLNSKTAPVLDAHSDFSTADVLGVIERGWLEDGKGKATARFAKNDDAADKVWNKIEQRILRNVSMGVYIHKLQETTEKNDKIKSYLAIDWEPREVSPVPIGADPGAHFQLAAGEQSEQEVEVVPRATSPEEPAMDKPIENNTGQGARENTAPPPAAPPQQNAQPPATNEQLESARKLGATAEQARIEAILRTAGICHLELSFAQKHIAENTTIETFRALAIDEQARRAAAQASQPTPHPDFQRDETETRRASMVGALLERYAPAKWLWDEKDKTYRYKMEGGQRMFDGARLYAACTLLDIAKECLAAQKIRWQTLSRTEIAQLAFQSTSDFPNILADVAGKTLRAGYEMVPPLWRQIAARRTAADFKAMKELTLDSSSRLEKVPESGEFHRGKLVEGKETWQLETYGKIIAITRQAVINDNLGAFTRTPQLLGQEVAMLEADTVFGIITTNGNLADGAALFSSTHSNLVDSGATISVDELGETRALMLKQTSPGGKPLNIQPRFLVVPAALAQLAEQYTSAGYTASEPAKINPLAGRLTPIIDARLDTNSPKKWYLFADPNSPNATVLIYAYLEGQEGPYTETRNGFDVDGVEIKIRHDFDAAAVDSRGAVQNDGE